MAEPQEIGRLTFSEAEIRRFAQAYDPRPAHVDAVVAGASAIGALTASPWHPVMAWMGFFVRGETARGDGTEAHPGVVAGVGIGFGFKDLRWSQPVRAGDTVVFRTEILSRRPSKNRPGWSVFHRRNTAHTAEGAEVLSFELHHMAPDPAPDPTLDPTLAADAGPPPAPAG